MCLEDCEKKQTRREFLSSAGIGLSVAALAGNMLAQTVSCQKKDDISGEEITFKNGADSINGYFARPKRQGKRRAVIILHGNAGLPDDIKQTAEKLAEAGFLGLAVSSTSREETDLSKLTQEFIMSDRFIRRYIADAQAGFEHLKDNSFLKDEKFGILGYCGGGYTAVRFAEIDSRVKAVVSLYAAPVFPPERKSQNDPRPNLLDFVPNVKDAPIQFHYGTNDHLIPTRDVTKLKELLAKNKISHEIYMYENADHGFASFVNPNYNAEYAALAEKRWREFFHKKL